MNAYSKTMCAALAATFGLSGALPAVAAPAFVPSVPAAEGSVLNVQMTDRQMRRENRQDRREFRRETRQDRREFRQDQRQDRRDARFERRNGNAFYNGRRGYRERRPGYREYNGYWFPAAAFIAGAIIGGASSSNTTVVVPGGSAHVEWCQNRYRSYRVSDNSFQPYNGPRQACNSPYS